MTQLELPVRVDQHRNRPPLNGNALRTMEAVRLLRGFGHKVYQSGRLHQVDGRLVTRHELFLLARLK